MMEIRSLQASDYPDVARIYGQGIATRNATFETEPPGWEVWDAGHLKRCRFVAVGPEGGVAGWAALSPSFSRCAYRGVCELSVYIDERHWGQGLGTLLLQALIAASEAEGLWTLEARIFPENVASMKLHRKMGFSVVGTRRKLGQMHGVWRDVVLLERRSELVGV